MRATDLPDVRALRLFHSLSDTGFDEMMQAAYLQNFPAQVELITEGESADFLHVVVEGCVELFATANGRESSMTMLQPTSTFILAAVLKDADYLMSARTYTRSRILMVPAGNVRAALECNPAFTRAVALELAGCYRGVVKAHKNIKLRTGVERLANCLLRYNFKQGGTDSFVLPYDKRKLASVMSMTPENLSRAFNTLKPYGVVVDGSTIHLTDIEGLTVLAKPNRLIDDNNA